MEIITVPASQIMPVSGYTAPPSYTKVKEEIDAFFFSKGPLVYKIYKNAYTSSLGDSVSPDAFVEDFFVALENSLKQQVREKDGGVEQSLAIKECFNVLRSTFKLLQQANVHFDPLVFYGTLVAFILSKFKK
ncbi:hypothetical protein EBR43_04795 [bacterium]|nr:hypothetical protein [bacterium]